MSTISAMTVTTMTIFFCLVRSIASNNNTGNELFSPETRRCLEYYALSVSDDDNGSDDNEVGSRNGNGNDNKNSNDGPFSLDSDDKSCDGIDLR